MAEGVGFEGANQVFYGAGEVRDLAVFNDGKQIISAWRLTPEERAKVAETGVVWLSVYGRSLPPVLVSIEPLVTIEGREPIVEPVIPLKLLKDRA
jgi:hypothetical protein